MTLRTPRRRISPRAKRRVRVIRDFFRRALGSPSQQDIKINSSIAVNVTDLKHKIVGIEHQLKEVSKHCQDLVCLESTVRRETECLLPDCHCAYQHDQAQSVNGEQSEVASHNVTTEASEEKIACSDTKLIYRPSETHYVRSVSDYISNANYSHHGDSRNLTLPRNFAPEDIQQPVHRVKKKRSKLDGRVLEYECEPSLQRHRAHSAAENVAAAYTSSYRSVAEPRPPTRASNHEHRREHKHRKKHEPLLLEDPPPYGYDRPRDRHKEKKKRNKSMSPQRNEGKAGHEKNRKEKRERKVDQEFITDIIKKQYKPVKMFGTRMSEISQISMPVCRDQEFTLREEVTEGTELCSCCYEEERQPHVQRSPTRLNRHDCQSVCDARLYRSKRAQSNRRKHIDIYNDSTLYDVVPVKEKPSPKSRRKFVEDNIIGYEYYKEVPPSPRTHRPRLNLKAQHHADYDEYIGTKHGDKVYLPRKHKRHQEYYENYLDSNYTSEIILTKNRKEKIKLLKPIKVQTSTQLLQDAGTMSSVQYTTPTDVNGQPPDVTPNCSSFNKTQETDITEKTDKALCEIKDILQCFLQEIKKETNTTIDKSDTVQETNQIGTTVDTKIIEGNAGIDAGPNIEGGTIGHSNGMGVGHLPMASHHNFTYTVGQCSVPTGFRPPFANPCCYPVMPMCPVNCMQNSYVMPNRSFCRCEQCGSKDNSCSDCANKKESQEDKSNETEELIKEIYKFVTLNPVRKKSNERLGKKEKVKTILTSRSVGGSSRLSRHDANVGTSAMKCFSKSCEAIGSRMITETSYTTQSDTVLEKLSLDITTTETELDSTDNSVPEKAKKSKFTNVLRSMGFMKKKKTEVTETESSFEVEIMPKDGKAKRAPFRQDIVDYMVQPEYYHRPPSPPYAPRLESYTYVPPPPGCEHRGPYYAPQPPPPGPHRVYHQTIHEHGEAQHPRVSERGYSPVPYQDPYEAYHHDQPPGPLCLKEIEVKSTGTQSERKMSFLRKIGKKTPQPAPMHTEAMQTQTIYNEPAQKPSDQKPPLLSGWKKFQEKVQKDLKEDPLAYGYKTKEKLMDGDKKMRNVMLKKLFFKRNPFSPNNLIIRTLLGNDPSSYGEPNISLKPRLFF